MKSLLIKLSKIFSVIRRDGLKLGTKRVWNYLKTYWEGLFNIEPGDILIVTNGVGDAALYRAYNHADELRAHGFKVSVANQDSPKLPDLYADFDIFIFQRTLYTESVSRLVEALEAAGKEMIYETDDLVFDAKYVQMTDHYKNMSPLEKLQYQKGVGEEILKDPYLKVCTTSTRFIATKLEEYGKKVFVVTNKLSDHWLAIADDLLRNHTEEKERGDKVRIGYFSGTTGHNRDFATISDSLKEILEKYPTVEIFIAGPLELEAKLKGYKEAGRIIQTPYVPREDHFKNIFLCDIILAPLELGDPFCEGKSELKFSESGLLEVPIVAVRNSTFSAAMTDGADGFLADTTAEWTEKLSRLIEDKNLRQNLGKKARERALQDYSVRYSHSDEYYAYLRSKLKK